MRDNHMREDNLRNQDRANAIADRLRAQFYDASDEMLKGSTLLNSGALVAMLGFTQGLVKTPGWVCYKQFALISMAIFLVGAASGPVGFMLRAVSARAALEENGKRARMFLSAMFFSAGFSVAAILCGAVVVGIGIYRSF